MDFLDSKGHQMAEAVNRQFYTFPKLTHEEKVQDYDNHGDSSLDTSNKLKQSENSIQHSTKLFEYISQHVVGQDKTFTGPFGLRAVTYLDYIASGRSLDFIESYIYNEVLPEYGNTHTTTSVTSLQTTLYRHEARDIVRNACNASEHDSVIFAGSGTTTAVHKLIHSLYLKHKPLVFVGPYEHHSNILPWKQVGSEIVRIRADVEGGIDLQDLETKLETNKSRGQQMIGVFSAASNISGVISDVDSVTVCLHKHGALAFWDYATAAPYLKIDMNPYIGGKDQHLVYKDAIYFSVHKFVGGTSSPGILIAKKSLFKNPVPHGCGGGSVFFVRRDNERYLQDAEMKEEGGTPAIVDSIRAGLVFQLKEAVGCQNIWEKDKWLLNKAVSVWAECNNLVILGPRGKKLPIFSFLVFHPTTGRFLHHNFVAAILNDVFGIQARGGCACAGPYAMDLLGLSEDKAKQMEELLAEDSRLDRIHLRRKGEYSHREILRPGFVRINLPYFMDEDSMDFVLEAITLVAEHAWTLLPQYLFNPETGEWRHREFQTFKDRKWLGHISYESGVMKYTTPFQHIKGPLPKSKQDCLLKAKSIFAQARKTKQKIADQTVMFDEEAKDLRWFVLPSEANICLQGGSLTPVSPLKLPFCPPELLLRLGFTEESEKRLCSHHNTHFVINDSRDEDNKVNFNNFQPVSNFSEGLSEILDQGFKTVHQVNEDILTDSISNLEINHEQVNDIFDENSRSQDLNITKSPNALNGIKIEEMEILVPSEISPENSNIKSASDNIQNLNQVNLEKDADLVDNGLASQMSCPFIKKQKSLDHNNEELSKNEKDSKLQVRWFSPPKDIFKPTVAAIEEYNMISDGDKILVCLSGGKDSLSLLHMIKQYQFYAKGKGVYFTFGAVTVDPMTPAYDPSPLKKYLAALGVPYFYESQCILETAENLPYECASICSFCSRMKRGRIYHAARREGYNVLALGQHLDDLSESFLMSFFHNGQLNTMKANYTVKGGDLRVVRPFVYVREADLRSFAEKNKLPIISENCPACFEAPKERHRNKQLLAAQEVMFPRVYSSMMAAMKPLMARGSTKSKYNKATLGSTFKEQSSDEES